MDQRDRLVRQTDILSRNATRPLREGVTGEMALPALEKVLKLLGEALETLEPLIELLFHACNKIRLVVPGVGRIELRHRRSAKGNEVVVYLVKAMGADPRLTRQVQITVFRFYDAEGGHRQGSAALEAELVPPQLVEALRLKLYYLMHFHVDFAGEPVLSQLFPGPKTVNRQPAPLSTVERMRRKTKLERAMRNAEGLYYQLEPRMPTIEALVRALADPLAFTVKEMLAPETRLVRLMAFRIGQDAEAQALLGGAVRDFAALAAAIAEARKQEDPAGLEEAAFPLSGFVQACRAHPALRELFPPEA